MKTYRSRGRQYFLRDRYKKIDYVNSFFEERVILKKNILLFRHYILWYINIFPDSRQSISFKVEHKGQHQN